MEGNQHSSQASDNIGVLSPVWRKRIAYRQTKPRGLPLAIRLNEGLADILRSMGDTDNQTSHMSQCMHSFDELIQRSTAFSLQALEKAQGEVLDALQTSSATPLVKTLQMIQLQKAISAVGMFSMFDAMLQDGFACGDGFRRAGELLEERNNVELKDRFTNFQLAINVLKHGRGRSYDTLVQKAGGLPFRIKLSDEAFFAEGDVSEVATLIEVNDEFVRNCANVITEVAMALRNVTAKGLE